MARRRSTTAVKPRRDYGIDRSWVLEERCQHCGELYVVNNYADHRPRRKKWLGLYVCAECLYRAYKKPLPRLGARLVWELAQRPCELGVVKKKKRRKCNCPPCRSWTLMDKLGNANLPTL